MKQQPTSLHLPAGTREDLQDSLERIIAVADLLAIANPKNLEFLHEETIPTAGEIIGNEAERICEVLGIGGHRGGGF
ncbi:MAG: hypothetical protein V4733_12560 [Verrucomicrobiota bacterium]